MQYNSCTRQAHLYFALGKDVTSTTPAITTNIYKLRILSRSDCHLRQTVDLAKCRINSSPLKPIPAPLHTFLENSLKTYSLNRDLSWYCYCFVFQELATNNSALKDFISEEISNATATLQVLLYCIILYRIVLYCIISYCIVLYCIILYCIVLYFIILYCIVIPPFFLRMAWTPLVRRWIQWAKKWRLRWKNTWKVFSAISTSRLIAYKLICSIFLQQRLFSYTRFSSLVTASLLL